MNFFKRRRASKDEDIPKRLGPTNSTLSNKACQNDSRLRSKSNGFTEAPLPRFNLRAVAAAKREFPTLSRLSMSLAETLADAVATRALLAFSESGGWGHLLRFWLDVESFRTTAKTRLRSRLNSSRRDPSVSPEETPSETVAFPTQNGGYSFKTSSHCDINGIAPPLPPPPAHDLVKDCSSVSRASKLVEADAVAIYRKYVSPTAAERVPLPESAHNAVVSLICGEDGRVDPSCFAEAQRLVLAEIEHRYPEFLASDFHVRYQIALLTGAEVRLSDILYHENALFYLMEFLENEGATPLLQFWLAAENFSRPLKTSLPDTDSATQSSADAALEALSDAMVIYDKYLSLQATESLGFPDAVRLRVESAICREDGVPDPCCFDPAVELVLGALDREYLRPFLGSPIYYRWLSELVNGVRLGGVPSGAHRPRSGSDASSSETGSTLLASGSVKRNFRSKGQKSVKEMIAESRIDADPDALWRKKRNAGPLIFGSVDDMGDFRSQLWCHPDTLKKKSSNRIAKAFKNLVHDESQAKAQELMATQIAQMVINDVTSLTMGRPAFETPSEDSDNQFHKETETRH